jgi:hypothetical protein
MGTFPKPKEVSKINDVSHEVNKKSGILLRASVYKYPSKPLKETLKIFGLLPDVIISYNSAHSRLRI